MRHNNIRYYAYVFSLTVFQIVDDGNCVCYSYTANYTRRRTYIAPLILFNVKSMLLVPCNL